MQRFLTPVPAESRRMEQLVATCRFTLASFALAAIWMDPLQPATRAALTYGLMVAYAFYSGALLISLLMIDRSPVTHWAKATHVLDVAVFGLLTSLTGAFESPLFVLFTCTVAVGALRWQVRGVVWTAATSTTALILGAILAAIIFEDPIFGAHESFAIMRAGYAVVMVAVLWYVAQQTTAHRRRVAEVIALPRTRSRDIRTVVEECLLHAARILSSRRVVLVWEQRDEPWVGVASWLGGEFALRREPPDRYGQLVDGKLADDDFFVSDARAPLSTVLRAPEHRVTLQVVRPIAAEFVGQFAFRDVLALRIEGELNEGWCFVETSRPVSAGDLLVGRTLAGRIAERLDLHLLLARHHNLAAMEERDRLSRELHDGVLQALGGAALTMKSASRKLETDPAGVRPLLDSVRDVLIQEQRDLRFYLEGLSDQAGALNSTGDLAGRLEAVAERLRATWGLRVNAEVEPGVQLSERVLHELSRIAQEGATNAVRHGGATRVEIAGGNSGGAVRLSIRDNGTGFNFRGRYDLLALDESRLGPVMLKARVRALGGSMVIESDDDGARLDIELPVPAEQD